MIGSGLKKLALSLGMNSSNGVAYGNLDGYAATMEETTGIRQLTLSTLFTDPERKVALQKELNTHDLKKEFRVTDLQLLDKTVVVRFADNSGDAKNVRAFIHWFLPLLPQYGAAGIHTCTHCAQEVTAGKWLLVNNVAVCVHTGCAQRICTQAQEEKQAEKPGSYLSGAVGAVLGALMGAIVWAGVLEMGYMASLVGLLIGWLAGKG